ncbi:MAG: hypothetical protein KBA46_03700 [Candidatus Omnitrophica bacterium]|nr:hypothetical protein [Candidatus Omnitrophota bacterium]
MKRVIMLCVGCAMVVSMCGCQTNQTRVAEGAVIGGLLGAAGGGIIGHQSGHGGAGAGIGAAAGALTGAIVGSQIEKPNAGTQATGSAPSANQMTMQQVVDLAKQGVHEDVIVDRIRLSGSRFTLTTEDVTYLTQQGVSQKVINAMQGV